MKKSRKNQNVFIDNIKIETQTVFNQNGNINIYPCSFEESQNIVLNGDRASQKGRMVTEDDGTSHFHAYATDSGSRYNMLFRTAHGDVKETINDIIFQLRFPKKLGKACIAAMLHTEQEEQENFYDGLNRKEARDERTHDLLQRRGKDDAPRPEPRGVSEAARKRQTEEYVESRAPRR